MNNIGSNVNCIFKKEVQLISFQSRLTHFLLLKDALNLDPGQLTWSTTHFMAGEVTFSSIFQISTR